MRHLLVLLAMGVLTVSNTAAAQDAPTGMVRGTVIDSLSNQPLAGARVAVVGTSLAVASREDGTFQILQVPAGQQTIRVTLIGRRAATATVNVVSGQTATVNFSLIAGAQQLEGMTVVGYGSQETRAVSAAISTVTAAQMKDIPTANAMQALQGRVPGVEIVALGNEPGSSFQVRVRGVRSMSNDRNEPLYVVDGVPLAGGVGDFNPNFIESVSVLKDAAATAIYGSRGSNGVVLITTKKGAQNASGAARFTLDAYYGTQNPVQVVPMMGVDNYVQYLQDAARGSQGNCNPANAGCTWDEPLTFLNPTGSNGRTVCMNADSSAVGKTAIGGCPAGSTAVNKRLYFWRRGITTDWQDAVLRAGLQKNVQAGVSGGSPSTRYTLQGNYFDQRGLLIGQGDNRGQVSLSLDHTASRFRVGGSAYVSKSLVEAGAGSAAYGNARTMMPFGSPFNVTNPSDSTGLWDPQPDDDQLNWNPYLEAESMVRETRGTRIFGSLYGELQLIDGMSWRTTFGPDISTSELGCYNGPFTRNACNGSQNAGQPPQAQINSSGSTNWTLDNLLQYNFSVGTANHFEFTGLHSVQKSSAYAKSLYATELPYDTQLWYDIGSGVPGNPSSSFSEWALESVMGRLNYNFNDRWFFSASGRYDGSSRLAEGNKWTFFPSASAAWQIGDEEFMRNFEWLDNLKIRASFGVTGNTSIAPYQTQGRLQRKYYSFGTARVNGYQPSSIPNPDLTWEKTSQTDIGFDWSTLQGRVTGSFDWYVQNTSDLLLSRQLPPSTGFTSTLQNVGETKNTGIEIGLSTINVQDWNGITWSSEFNFQTNKNEIVSLQSGVTQDLANVWFVGQPINLSGDPSRRVFFNHQYAGIWQETAADSSARAAFAAPGGTAVTVVDNNGNTIFSGNKGACASSFAFGDPKVKDLNGDYCINADDRKIVGTGYPSWTGSWYNRVTYKAFDFSMLLSIKNDYLFVDETPRSYTARLGIVDDMDYWRPSSWCTADGSADVYAGAPGVLSGDCRANASNKNPRAITGGNQADLPYSATRMYTDGSHWRIRNITFGWTPDANIASRIGAASIRVYATIQEAYVGSNYLGADPEVRGGAPTPRTLLLGTNITW